MMVNGKRVICLELRLCFFTYYKKYVIFKNLDIFRKNEKNSVKKELFYIFYYNNKK